MGYMSPEQAQGKTDKIDRRSDVFSFGCILFETITGRKPFEGSDAIDSLNKIIREPAPPISSLNPTAPNDLQRIVRRCLAKDPDERYQTIKDVAIELKEVRRELESSGGSETTVTATSPSEAKTLWKDEITKSAGGSTSAPETRVSSAEFIVSEIKQHKTRFALVLVALLLVVTLGIIGFRSYLHAGRTEVAVESIAVVPFTNQDGDQSSEWISDGLTESIINSLTQLPNLKVIARSTVFRYKGKQTDPIAIGKELGVRAVLTGRVSQRADSVVISTELIDIRDNKQLWGEQFERKMADMLSVQRDIAREITTNLRPTLTGEQQSLAMKQHTQNPEAYSLYLKGRFYWNKRTPDDFNKAITFFRQAIDKDPNYALAYSGLADSYALIAGYGFEPARLSMPEAKAAAQKALALDDNLAEAHASMGQIYAYEFEWQSAEREYKRAIQLNPNYPSARQWYAEHLSARGLHNEAVAEIQRAMDLDPLSLIINRTYGDVLADARRFDEAIEQYRKTIDLDPSFVTTRFFLGRALAGKGMYKEAVEEFRKTGEGFAGLDEAYVKGGWKGYLQATIERIKKMMEQGYFPPFVLASYYAQLGDRDRTMEALEKAYADRDFRLTQLKVSFEFDSVRDDPRFIDLTKRVGIP
jgi:TolB-like protein/Tfp pilus assembly protein PilF